MLRPILDFFIFFARHMVITFAIGVVVVWVATRWMGLPAMSAPAFSRARRLAVAVPVFLLAVFGAIGVWYLGVGGFAGEVEPSVSCLSWLVQSGRPLYTGFESAERYSVLYGPSVFLTNGLFLRILGPSLFSAKLASVIGTFGSLVFLYAAARRKPRDRVAFTVTGLAVLYYWAQGFAVYLVRPDALLLFAVGLGLYGATRCRRWLSIIVVAAAVGFSINLKVHALLYFLPIFVIVARRFGRHDLLRTGLGTALIVLAPFVLYPQVSLVNYIGWLTNGLSHGLAASSLDLILQYTGFLLLPLASCLLVVPRRREFVGPLRADLAALAAAYVGTVVLATKPGAGPVHLLPLVPTTMYLLGLVIRQLLAGDAQLAGRAPLRQAVLAATVVTALLSGSVNAYRAVRYVDYQIGQIPGLAQDVQGIMATHPGLTLAMGCGGENLSFRCTWLRPLLVFADNPLLIDPISVMDASLAGKPLAAETYRAISEGRVKVWLVPRQQVPFAKENWYAPHNPLFPNEFRELFMASYTRRDHSRYFDLWFWNGLPEVAVDPAGLAAISGAR